MKTVSLSGSPRVNVGKKGAANLRKNGSVPSVVYGGKEQIHFSILENEAKKNSFYTKCLSYRIGRGWKKIKCHFARNTNTSCYR